MFHLEHKARGRGGEWPMAVVPKRLAQSATVLSDGKFRLCPPHERSSGSGRQPSYHGPEQHATTVSPADCSKALHRPRLARAKASRVGTYKIRNRELIAVRPERGERQCSRLSLSPHKY